MHEESHKAGEALLRFNPRHALDTRLGLEVESQRYEKNDNRKGSNIFPCEITLAHRVKRAAWRRHGENHVVGEAVQLPESARVVPHDRKALSMYHSPLVFDEIFRRHTSESVSVGSDNGHRSAPFRSFCHCCRCSSRWRRA